MVNHSVLMRQPLAIGITQQLVRWMEAFLVGHTMRVSCGGHKNSSKPVLSGVPQGSVLGPLLFTIYVNSLTDGLSAKCMAFADDFKLFLHCSEKDSDNLLAHMVTLQRDLDKLSSTAASWNLQLNTSKCVVMRFYMGRSRKLEQFKYVLNGVSLDYVEEYKDLGVTVDVKLKFHSHVRNVVWKATGLASYILRSTVNRDADFIVTIFKSHVRPILDYCSSLWNVGYLGDSQILESVQRRWTKQVTGLADVEYHERLQTLGLFSIRGRLLRADLIKCWKASHCSGDVDLISIFSLAPEVGTRGHHLKLCLCFCYETSATIS